LYLYNLYSASHSAYQSEALPLTCLGGADAVVLQSNFVQRTCLRSLRSNCLRWGSNPYSPRYRPSALTDRPCATQSHKLTQNSKKSYGGNMITNRSIVLDQRFPNFSGSRLACKYCGNLGTHWIKLNITY